MLAPAILPADLTNTGCLSLNNDDDAKTINSIAGELSMQITSRGC